MAYGTPLPKRSIPFYRKVIVSTFFSKVNTLHDLTDLPGLDLEWQMTRCERFALIGLLERIRPALSLEIGTYRGGSLQVLSRFSSRAISLDIDPSVSTRLGSHFSNVEFVAGDSGSLLPNLVSRLNGEGAEVGFILIDGDHSADGVRRDINAVLQLRPKGRMVMILHDSFNPECRRGMRTAAWAACRHVHHVELDFVPGIYHFEAHDTAEARTMWGGFACAVLEAQPRTHPLVIGESQKGLFDAVYRDSAHAAPQEQRPTFSIRVLRALKRRISR